MDSGLLIGHDEDVARWIAEGFEGLPGFYPPYSAFGYVRDGRLVAGALFNAWNGANIEITIRTEGVIPRSFMRACYQFCFDAMGAARVTAKTKRSNKKVCRILPKLGFTHEGTLRHWYGDGKENDAIVFRMLRGDTFRY